MISYATPVSAACLARSAASFVLEDGKKAWIHHRESNVGGLGVKSRAAAPSCP